MNVYIGWSGDTGRKLAEILKRWLGAILPEIHFVTNDEIESVSDFLSALRALRNLLATADYGILCLTKESLDSTWLAYEAGMLAQREPPVPVISFLFGVNHVHGLFRNYQCYGSDKTGILRLVDMLLLEAVEKDVELPPVNAVRKRADLMLPAFQSDLKELGEAELLIDRVVIDGDQIKVRFKAGVEI